jgi:AraC-like DNA-binding protein
MIYQTRKPTLPLASAVESIWIYSGYRPPHSLERVLPSGTIEWVINLHEDRLRCYNPETLQPLQTLPGSLIAGPRSSFQVIDTEQQTEIMGVHFRAGGMRYFSSIPADEFAELDVPLDCLWGRSVNELREQLTAGRTPHAKIQVLETWLTQKFCDRRKPHRCVAEAVRRLEPGESPTNLAALAADLGLSSRRFIEVFRESVGLTPKVYARLRRFQSALQRIHGAKNLNWADIAFDGGWCDQAHLIRDFKQFSGLTPAEYGRMQGEFTLHVPVEERGQICPIPDSEHTVESAR